MRLRDEARLAAEREALEIVTAARRDVRRIVVQARRELLVLTAQLHAAVESVDQASLQAAAGEAGEHPEALPHQALANNAPLGATREMVMGARREVRSVLDEARAEIEALAAEANGPLRDDAKAIAAAPEPPIPTLETILGSDPLAPRAPVTVPRTASDAPAAEAATPAAEAGRHQATPPEPWLPTIETSAVPSPSGPAANAAVPFGGLAEPHPPFGGFHASEFADRMDAPETPLAAFGETGPVAFSNPDRAFLADYEESPRTRPAWLWVGLFAATGVLAIAGTGWWFTTRESDGVLAAPATASVEAAGGAAVAAPTEPGVAEPTTGTAASRAAAPSGLSIEVRRTAWIRTVVDGKEDSRVYQAGETRQIVGARTVALRAGDAGAVFVSVDGRPAEALGASGQAVTKQYSLAPVAGVVPAVAGGPGAPVVAPATAESPSANVLPQPEPAPAPPTARATQPVQPAAAAPAAAASVAPPVPVPPATAAADAAPNTVGAGGGRADIVAAGQQWLDAYQRRDRDAMAASGTENISISDERSVTERFPAWQVGVRRDLDQVELELTGDTALLTARMVERGGDNVSTSAQHVSRVSQIWVRRGGRWRLADVRIIGEARLNQIVR